LISCLLPVRTMSEASQRRFWAKVDKAGPVPSHRPELGPCWVWLGATAKGYGVFRVGSLKDNSRRMLLAHVYAVYSIGGDVPIGCVVMHKCDNRKCCNPLHLDVGTQADNIHDMHRKRRHSHGERHSITQRGEGNGRAKLSEHKVHEARRRAAAGESVASIARSFGLGHSTVLSAVRRETWRHI
jgi:hypothetical protein